MIELVKVELKNFRSFAEATFSPLGIGQGMTAINGANGMGKSSIVHAIVWALYGITPDGVRVGALRRQGSEGQGDVEAKVTLTFNGQTICVTRGLRGKNDTTIASIELDGVEQTNVSSRTASQWITNYIGLDAEAFLTAFIIRQKELDSLVRARPAERRKTIERLAGIERMSKALEIARQEARETQRVVDALPAATDPAEITKQLTDLREHLAVAEDARTAAEKTFDELQKSTDIATAKLSEERLKAEQQREIRQSIDLLNTRIEDLKGRITTLSPKAAEAINLEKYVQEAKAAAEALQSVQDEWELFQNIKQQETVAQSAIISCEKAAKGDESRLLQAKDALANLQDELSNLMPVEEKNIDEYRKKIQTLNEELGLAKGNQARMEKALATMQDHLNEDEQANCPTCEQALADPAAIVKALEESISTARNEIPELQKQLENNQHSLKNAEDANRAYETLEQKIIATEASISALIDASEASQKDLASARSSLSDIQEQLNQFGSSEEISSKREKLRVEKEEAEARQRQAESAQEAAEEVDTLQASLDKRTQEKAEKLELLADMKDIPVDISELEAEVSRLNAQLLPASTTAKEAAYEVERISQQVSQLEAEEKAATAQIETRKAALRDAEVAAAAAQSLADFRTDRLARLTPELSEVATDFVSRMTDGKYTSVVLDDEFTPVLTDSNGQERPVAWLSGGEESAVALALRVAIGEVLAGQRGGLLVLDEVLTAQDAGRRQATMSAIKNLPRQIITINHVSEATDMVDLVANIVNDGSDASTIEEWAPDVLGGNVSDAILDA